VAGVEFMREACHVSLTRPRSHSPRFRGCPFEGPGSPDMNLLHLPRQPKRPARQEAAGTIGQEKVGGVLFHPGGSSQKQEASTADEADGRRSAPKEKAAPDAR